MEKHKEQTFNTITSDDWKRSIAKGRSKKNRAKEFIRKKEQEFIMMNGIKAEGQDVETIRELLLQLVRTYTLNHDHLSCEAVQIPSPTAKILVFTIQSEQSDFKKLVGSQGRNARTLSHLMREIGKGLGVMIETRIKSPVGNVAEPQDNPPFDESSEFNGAPIANLIQVVVSLMTGAPCKVSYSNIPGMTVFTCESPDAPKDYQQPLIRQLFMLSGNKVRRQFSVEFV